jgi:TetR/AcrR family transcriptional regulator, transcriptional repressor for nem operon
MRYTPEHNEETRERILTAASRLFREHGIAAVGLAKVMAEAELTVGTFYTHFESKEALVREALLRSIRARNEEFERALRAGDLETAIRAYLSPEHRDAPAAGCVAAALASEVARHPRATRLTFAGTLEPTLDALAELLSTRRGKKAGRADAAAFFGLLVGTVQLARATPERAESAAILEAGIHAALRLAGGDDHRPSGRTKS